MQIYPILAPRYFTFLPIRSRLLRQHDTVHHTTASGCCNDGIQFLRNCEYYMIIGCIKYVLFLCINPFLFQKLLAHGTASASAGVIMNADTSAVLTNTDVYTKSACFTVHDMISCFSMMSRRAIPLFIRRIKPFKYILYRT